MKWKEEYLKDCNLYVILDRQLAGNRDLVAIASELSAGGAGIIQYRDKVSSYKIIMDTAERLSRLGLPLIINDYPKIAKTVNAGGVHLGQTDIDIAAARKIIGEDKIVGCSTHCIEEAEKAKQAGADYIGVGPVFATTTKKDVFPVGTGILKQIMLQVNIPAFAIGGINLDNLDTVLSVGMRRIAVGKGILGCVNVKSAASDFCRRIACESDRMGKKGKTIS